MEFEDARGQTNLISGLIQLNVINGQSGSAITSKRVKD